MNSDTENPFRPPEARLDEPDATHGEPLYRLSAIGLGTFIGTPLAGAFLAAVNLRRLGRAQEVGKTWLVGLCLFVLLPVLGAILPENIPSIGFTVAQILAAEADQPFASEDWVLAVESLDGRTRREWRFSYNAVMEAEPQADGESWRLTTGEGAYQLRCLGAVSASGEDE